ncbi:unnamed protein product, partial [Iphiclides podalirius]
MSEGARRAKSLDGSPRASMQVSGSGRAAGVVGVQAAPPRRSPRTGARPPLAPAVYSRPSGGATVARVTRNRTYTRRQSEQHTDRERCIRCRTALRGKKSTPHTRKTAAAGSVSEARPARRVRSGVAENAFPGCIAQAARTEGRVQAMMDIVLISICPRLPYCGDAGRAIDRCTGPELTPRDRLRSAKPDFRSMAAAGARVECAGVDSYSSRARPDSAVPPSELPAMATETGGAAAEQQYSLRWNDFHSAMVSSFRRLRDEEDFVDVTLACAGATFSAHKVVLSACSPYFRRLLKANPCQHPIVILRDVHDKDMESLLRFMYQGEVHIGQEQLKEFLRAAQLLQVRGLTDVPPPAPAPLPNLEQKPSPSASSWTEGSVSREGAREGGAGGAAVAARGGRSGQHAAPQKGSLLGPLPSADEDQVRTNNHP